VRLAHAATLARDIAAVAEAIGARLVGLYAPIGAEPDTRPLANALLARGFALAYPRLTPDGATMEFAPCQGPAALVQRPRSRLLEPAGPACDAGELDLLVVPSLALAPDLTRLGRGGGHYDRYLPQLAPQAVTIAACAAACAWDWQPREPHDRKLAAACSEAGLFGPRAGGAGA